MFEAICKLSVGARAWLAGFPIRFQRKISQGAYRPEVDGLRFFAIAFVVFGHSLERAVLPSISGAPANRQAEPNADPVAAWRPRISRQSFCSHRRTWPPWWLARRSPQSVRV